MTTGQTPRDGAPPSARPRRADAERNVERILHAALEALASDPEASMASIARRADVARATIYVHFPTRETLIEAVTERAIDEVTEAMKSAEPDRDDPSVALQRLLTVAWRELGRLHALVGINVQRPPAELRKLHRPVFALLQPLIERGQRDETFRPDVSASWHISMLLALVHAASVEVQGNRLPVEQIESALLAAALGAVTARPDDSPRHG